MDEIEIKYLGKVLVTVQKDITKINLSNKGITSIELIKGLESLSNIRSLDLDDNKITEIKGLEPLEMLERLNLSGNQITEIKGLESLSKSGRLSLNLSGNQITEINI